MRYIFCKNCKPKIYKWFTMIMYFAFLTFIGVQRIEAQDDVIELEPIIVTAGRIPSEAIRATRSVSVITKEEIEQAPAHSIEELLEYTQGVDVRRRGVYGVQSDMSIRGSTYEQVLILVDGVKMTDPQTGHHNMDIPVTLEDIDRIEVVRGGASSVHGANAFGGTINIITKKPEGKKIVLEGLLGEHILSRQALSLTYPVGIFNNRFSFERKESSGYMQDTDFEIRNFFFSSNLEFEKATFEYMLGYIKKDFGADSFYSNLYPQEEEHTDTRFTNIRGRIKTDALTIKPLVYYRRHQDKYILDRTRPWWYTNYHTSYSYGGELEVDFNFPFAGFALGAELGKERVESTSLKDHSRLKEAFFAEFEPKIHDKLILNLGVRADHYEGWDFEVSPGFNAGYFILPEVKLRGSVARAFRVPSFTELYYDSPANKGNENLSPEESWSYEGGIDFAKDWFYSGITVFRRQGRDLIDWTRASTSDPWQVQNTGKVDTDGIEAEIKISPEKANRKLPISNISLGYAYLYSDKKEDNLLSKYVMDYLKHQFTSGIGFDLPFGLKQTLKFSYEERLNLRHYFLLDTRISKEMKQKYFTVELFINITNLLNTSYNEIGGVPMPGRWAECGIKLKF